MFKKFLLSCAFVLSVFLLSACEPNFKPLVYDNMSEITKSYYCGQDENYFVSLSIGQRESEFVYNGISTKKVDYALLSISNKTAKKHDAISVYLSSNDMTISVDLVYKESNQTYVADIVDKIEIGDFVDITYSSNKLRLERCQFEYSADKAFDIAYNDMYDTLKDCKSYNNFYAECYLVVLNINNFDDFYWCFTCLDRNLNSKSILISCKDGSVVSDKNN